MLRNDFSTKKYTTILGEVNFLLITGFIQDAYYLKWQSNVLLVMKFNKKWRMCMDFIDLNKACLKDSFPLPCIDLIIDSIAKHLLVSFMDVAKSE